MSSPKWQPFCLGFNMLNVTFCHKFHMSYQNLSSYDYARDNVSQTKIKSNLSQNSSFLIPSTSCAITLSFQANKNDIIYQKTYLFFTSVIGCLMCHYITIKLPWQQNLSLKCQIIFLLHDDWLASDQRANFWTALSYYRLM